MAATIEYGPEDPSFSRSLITNHDVLIFDFGLDAASLPSSNVPRVTDWPRDQRYRLGAIARCLASCAEECHTVSRSTPSSSLPDFLVVNPNHHPFDQFVSQFLLTTKTPYNTRVRKGRARVGDERLYRSHRWKLTEEAMQSFFGYDVQDGSAHPLAPGDSIDFTSLASSSRYKDGELGRRRPHRNLDRRAGRCGLAVDRLSGGDRSNRLRLRHGDVSRPRGRCRFL